ncbi:BTAD domain-containing putative transcriptional regulator [Nocardia sp. NPDC050175]|uniref:AfsR/SARP family transcriptional regulator n=1 Tax=Nocardia sp. NPDC050175 TaxID=3364317 RepID=UPI0037AB9743
MTLKILGPVEATRDGRELALPGKKLQTMLAILLLSRGRVVSVDRLSFLLWGWNPPTTVDAQIYTYISRLRKRLSPEVELIRRAPGYRVDTKNAWVDIEVFEEMAQQGRDRLAAGLFEEASKLLRAALGIWRGSALTNVTEYLTETELPGLDEAWTTTTEYRIDAELALGLHRTLILELVGLVNRFPFRERLRVQLMAALYLSGRQAEALAVYEKGRALLADELGVDPGFDLVQAFRAVLDGDPGLFPLPGLHSERTAILYRNA